MRGNGFLQASGNVDYKVGWTSSLYLTHFFLFEILRKNTGFGNNGRTTGNFAPLLVLPLPCKLPEMTCFTQKEVGNTETSSPSSFTLV